MEVTVNIATQLGREDSLKQTLKSLRPQVKAIRVWCNGFKPYDWLDCGVEGHDVGSAGKFMFVQPNEIYCSCDDDIIYPPNYIETIVAAQQKHGGYVSFHGRKLAGTGKKYYSGHYYYACTKDAVTREIDVPGTGVGCFNTNEFNPTAIWRPEWRNMDDVAMGYLLAEAKQKVTLIGHNAGWIKTIHNTGGIWYAERLNSSRQNSLSDKIYLMRNEPPKVSVIIPYVKDRGYLQQAIDSVHKQMYAGEIELILSQSNQSVGHNINQGIKEATGKYIKYLCDDDYLPPMAIHESVQAIKGHLALCGGATNFWPTGKTQYFTPTKPNIQTMLINNQIHGGSLMYGRDVFTNFGLFDSELKTGEEYEFNLRLIHSGIEFAVLNRNLYFYRRHDAQKSLGKDADQTWRRFVIDSIKAKYQN